MAHKIRTILRIVFLTMLTIAIANANVPPAALDVPPVTCDLPLATCDLRPFSYNLPFFNLRLFTPDHSFFQFTGRIDFSKPTLPKFSAPGVYIRANFSGTACEVLLNDESLWGKSHNYITIVIDNGEPRRIKLKQKENVLRFDNLKGDRHSILICKSTEANIGYVEFVGLKCRELLPPDNLPERRIEFIGNSITCGMGSDESETACDQGEWYDQHNAFMAYGPQVARALKADWMLTSVSGIGLIHSCCDMKLTMPDVFDKVDLRQNEGAWDFTRYTPDVVTICLGQNDGIQDSTAFCGAYVSLISKLRERYENASIVCLTSPMGDEKLTPVLKKYLSSITAFMRKSGDQDVHEYFFQRRYTSGCGSHPSLAEHSEIADELTAYIKALKKW